MNYFKADRFEAERSYELVWRPTKRTLEEAKGIAENFIQQRVMPISFYMIVKDKMGIPLSEDVPEDKAHVFADNVAILCDGRKRLKEELEPRFPLVTVGSDGISMRMNGNGPRGVWGFDYRESEAGIADDRCQLNMALGQLEHALDRQPVLKQDPRVVARVVALLAKLGASTALPEPPQDMHEES